MVMVYGKESRMTPMSANGSSLKHMATECTSGQMVTATKANGKWV